jgi:farnesyl diphosphate synthase
MKIMTDFQQFTQFYQQRIEQKLAACLVEEAESPEWLHQAMRYSSLGGGKRFRALLVYCCGHACGVSEDDLLDAGACAVELIHAYSLIHDDLPAMDNSDLRRGKPTCHLAFDEATAILAGDALQALAFEVLTTQTAALPAEKRLTMTIELAKACGTRGMAGGQALDLRSGQVNLTLTELIHLHHLKTGALIECSATIGALCANNLSPEKLQAIYSYAHHLGLAFQIKDDMLDVDGDTATLGKPKGIDDINQKTTFVSLLNYQGAQTFLLQEYEQAITALQKVNLVHPQLMNLAKFVINRNS